MSEKGECLIWIRRWDAAYYNYNIKKWLYGTLKLATHGLSFSAKADPSQSTCKPAQVYVEFENVKDISKAMSSMVFPSLTVKTTSDDIHWFSSLQDRNGTFIVMKHFFEASLLLRNSEERPNNELPASVTSRRTSFGTALLNSVLDSDVTLRDAASNLVRQGDQLTSISLTMQDMHQDLTVAERLTAGLNSWCGRWKIPKATKATEFIFVKDNDISDVLDIEVLYTKVSSSKIEPQTVGVCRASADGITILDLKQKVIHHFKWSEVSRVQAVSPWEIMVTQYLIGQPDLSFSIVSVQMPRILSKITVLAGRKVEYLEPEQNAANLDRTDDMSGAADYQTDSSSHNQEQLSVYTKQQQQQQQQHQASAMQDKTISDTEIAELSAALDSIKATALGVRVEQNAQLDAIDDLTSSVVRASDRIRTMNRTVDKLMK